MKYSLLTLVTAMMLLFSAVGQPAYAEEGNSIKGWFKDLFHDNDDADDRKEDHHESREHDEDHDDDEYDDKQMPQSDIVPEKEDQKIETDD